ncbi:MAG: response regulator [Lachnospiraceae bacterium]|nr:response regulator [Lachnospiraceae bacterium]
MKSTVAKQFMITVLVVFILQILVLSYIFTSFYSSSTANIKSLGISNMKSQATMIENYMNKGRDVLWLAADSVDFMIKQGTSKEAILEYLLDATNQMQEEFDANFTGIYGYLNGNYIDGSGWVPPDDYVPTDRAWYIEGKEANGEMVMSEPYVDAQTGEVIISFSQMLSDGESVISLDIMLGEVQKNTEQMNLSGGGYGFIVDDSGLVIAHSNSGETGKNYFEKPDWKASLDKIFSCDENQFQTTVDGEKTTIFSEKIVKDWRVVIVVTNTQLFRDIRRQIIAGILLSLLTFIVIVIFSMVSARRISSAEIKESESREKLEKVNMNIIRALASTIDAKDRYTSGHSQRVAEYSLALAKRLGKSEDDQQIIFYAGLLHDVGKIRVPEEVINKDGKLTDEEFDQIRIHPVSGFHILRDIHEDERIGYGAKYHHERYDGKGYPNGLEGENIPEVARIIAVADSYDAMTSNRSYRDALPQDVVREQIEKGRGSQFDPVVAEEMLKMMAEDKDYNMRETPDEVKNVLVVDDEQMNIMMVEYILNKADKVKLFTANNAEEALDILANKNISLILLDLLMPNISGLDLYKMVREKYTMPVVLMTADKSAETLKNIREYGIDDYLTKPLNAFVTLETVHGILHGSHHTKITDDNKEGEE